MSSLIQNIKLSGFTFASRIVSGSVVYIVLARIMTVNDFGVLTFGTTLAGLLAVMAEFGFSLMAQRDIPQNRFNFNKYVFNTLLQKIGFSVITIVGGFIYLKTFYNGINFSVGIIFAFNAILTSYIMYFFSVFRAKNMFVVESWISILYAIFSVIIVVLYYFKNLDVIFVAYSLLFIRLIQFIILIVFLIKKFDIKPILDKKIQTYLFKNSYSFGLHYIIGIFYFSIDNQLLAYYSGNEALAIYQAIFKLVLILLAVNSLFEMVFLPFLSSQYKNNKQEFTNTAKLINKTIIIFGLSLFVFFNLFVSDIVTILYSDKYIIGLSIAFPLSLVLLFRIQTTIYSVILTISNHQNLRVVTVFVSLIINLVLNFIFIPKYGFVGAAYVSMLTHIVMLILYVTFTKKYINSFIIDKETIILTIFTIILLIFINYFNFKFSFVQAIAAFVVFIVTLIFVLKKEQINKLKLILKGSYY